MKGLVTTISALAAAAAFAEGVTSANTVGYLDKQSSTFQLVTPTFVNVDGSTLTLGQLVPADGWDPGSDKIYCYTGASKDYEATYLDQATVDDIGENFENLTGLTAGWYDYADFNDLGNTEPAVLRCYNARQINYGNSGFAIRCSVALRFVGQVVEVAQPIQSSTFKLVGNCSPTDRTLADFVPADGWDPGSDKIYCYTGASKDYEATYLDQATVDDIGENFENLTGLTAGWYDYADFNDLGNTEPAVLKCYNTRPVPAGSGFAIRCGVAINVPSATAN